MSSSEVVGQIAERCQSRDDGYEIERGKIPEKFPVVKPLWLDIVVVTRQLLLATWTNGSVVSLFVTVALAVQVIDSVISIY
jgi:hypothetical protein